MACLFCANDAEEQLNKLLCIVCVENDLCGVFIAQMLVVEIVNLHSARMLRRNIFKDIRGFG